MTPHPDIRLGTLVPGKADLPTYLRTILPHGFESVSITFWQRIPDDVDLARMATEVRRELEPRGAVVSSLSVFGNPLGVLPIDDETRRDWKRCIDAAKAFGCDLVTGFAGRVVDQPVPESIPRYVEVFAPLAKHAATAGVRLAFENCPMGGDWQRGDWNIAWCPEAWRLMFAALTDANIGLQWEPCHQLCRLVEPLPQLREWLPRVFHVHGKDATIWRDVLRTVGIGGPEAFAHHRHPGFGDTDWRQVIDLLRLKQWRGSIDIEGWHDPVYKDQLELTGQVSALRYLQRCRGGEFIAG